MMALGDVPSIQELRRKAAARTRNIDCIRASELIDGLVAEEQLVEGLLGARALSMLYGDSNSGKTFLAIDLACAVAQGTNWMGRSTVGGLVIYLASEAPGSVALRLHAYQKWFGVSLDNLIIVRSPITLFDDGADVAAVTAMVRQEELKSGKQCRLIIGDTLARLGAGANENSGAEMGTVIANADKLKSALGVHVMLIHHSGKDAGRGARGWSGVRAAMDTEIEVLGPGDERHKTHVARITKQRDIGGKGQRIGFALRVVDLGTGQWEKPVTTCIVEPAEAPDKPAAAKKESEVGKKVLRLLDGRTLTKSAIVKALEEHHLRSTVYRCLKDLHAAGMVAIKGNEVSAVRQCD